MRDYWLTKDLLQATGIVFIVVSLLAIGLALWLPKRWWGKLLAMVAVGFVISIPVRETRKEEQQLQVVVDGYKERYAKAKALFDERCKTAGERIYKTVEAVEGLELINPRPPQRQGIDEKDQNWVGAGLPGESTGNQYIMNFLFYDIPDDGRTIRSLSPGGTSGPYGSITAGIAPKGAKGYRYVEVEANNNRYQYRLKSLSSYVTGGDPVEAYGRREVVTGIRPKYAVAYEDITDPEGRANWIAGARLKVLDQQSGELLAELVQFSFEAGFGSDAGARQPWAFAQQCPSMDRASRPIGTVRFFVEKILKPKQG